ncbi:MAG: helix-turn-helix transcriptional regulator [Holosporaceae bacterium]|jgi:transcriptional regulator with XRE-family HTH domain|nr:helix-turn-helix transcriptional regulator [Holosporaceae bacterium]
MADYLVPEQKPHRSSLDLHIGNRIKARRSLLGISQEKLGRYLQITFQQIQKYEKGANRVSASTLYDISIILSVDISYFYEGYNNRNITSLNEDITCDYDPNSISKKETAELLRFYNKIENRSLRKKILELLKQLALSQKTDQ